MSDQVMRRPARTRLKEIFLRANHPLSTNKISIHRAIHQEYIYDVLMWHLKIPKTLSIHRDLNFSKGCEWQNSNFIKTWWEMFIRSHRQSFLCFLLEVALWIPKFSQIQLIWNLVKLRLMNRLDALLSRNSNRKGTRLLEVACISRNKHN